MKLLSILALTLLALVAAQDYYEDSYDADEMDAGKKNTKPMGNGFRMAEEDDMEGGKKTSGFRVNEEEEDDMEGGKKNKKPMQTQTFRVGDSEKPGKKNKKMMSDSFRVASKDSECHQEVFQIASVKYPKMCLDASSKRVGLVPCAENSEHALFSTARSQFPSMFHLKNKDSCLSSSSLTMGPCVSARKNYVQLSRGPLGLYTIHMADDKCVTVKTRKANRLAKCAKKNKAQHFRFVPIFDAIGGNMRMGGGSDDSMQTEKSSGFRVAEDDDMDGGKKKKMGEQPPMGSGFRIADDDDDDDEMDSGKGNK